MRISDWSSDVCSSDLAGLGLSARADALKRANPDRADSIDEDVNRLTSPEEMGVLFKALAVTAPDWAIPAAFPTGGVDESRMLSRHFAPKRLAACRTALWGGAAAFRKAVPRG